MVYVLRVHRNVQHHIETAILNAARKEILVFHKREQLHVRRVTKALVRLILAVGVRLCGKKKGVFRTFCHLEVFLK